MKVLVTGGGGFLGSHIVDALLARGDEVRSIARSAYPELEAKGVECLRGDVAEAASVDRAVEGMDAVIHVASKVGYWGAYEGYERVNVGGARAIVEACRKHGVERLVYTSTPSVVIGPKGQIEGADETLPYPDRYLSPYGPTKAEAERIILGADSESLRTVSLRPHFIYGPKDPQLAPRLVMNAERGTIAQIGDGQNLVDVTYIDNAVEAHLAALDALAEVDAPCRGQAYFISDGAPIKLWDFVAQVLNGLGAPPVKKRLSFGAAKAIGATVEATYRLLRVAREPPLTRMAVIILGTSHYFSHDKAARDLGYVPAIKTEEGLARTVAAGRL